MTPLRLLLSLLFAATACFAGDAARVGYKTVQDRNGEPYPLKLYIFNPPGHNVSDSRPAIIFFFGGGWKSGHPNQFGRSCQYLASRGMVAISADYRTSDRNNTTPREALMDAKSAIRWVRQHAGELGIDPDRIAAGGQSAGGHLAAAAGTTKGFEEEGEDLKISSRPNALVLLGTVFDNGPDGFAHERVKAYWQEFSPLHNITPEAPPTAVFLGTRDKHIPVATAEKYKTLMEKAGVRCDLYLYEKQGHGCFRPEVPEVFNRYLTEMDQFLASLGYLQGEPTIAVLSGDSVEKN